MNNGTDRNGNIATQRETSFKLYKYRWFVLFLFCSYAFINFMQYTEYAIITNIIAKYYGIDIFTVSWTILVFMISYIVLCIPASYLMEKFNLRKIAILASTLTACGIGIRLFSVSPDGFYLVIIGQILVAIAQVFILSLPSKVAATWFASHEISTASAIAVFGSQLGVALSCVISPSVIKNHEDIDLIGEELFTMILYNAIFGYVICFLVVLFYEDKPRTPPNYSHLLTESAPDIDYIKSLKNLAQNRDFILLLASIGGSTGLLNAYGIHANTIYLHYFPGREEDIGIISLIGLLSGGCFGSVIFGYLLDKTHKFKLITFCLLALTSISFLISSILLNLELRIPAYVSQCFYGFFISSLLVVGFEYSAEVTYPEPEATALAAVNGIIAVFGIIFSVIIESLFEAIGHFYTNITIACIYGACTFVVIGVSENLRRLKTNQLVHYDDVKAAVS